MSLNQVLAYETDKYILLDGHLIFQGKINLGKAISHLVLKIIILTKS